MTDIGGRAILLTISPKTVPTSRFYAERTWYLGVLVDRERFVVRLV